ncbi:NADP-dependent oxidoreductase [Streptomyces sp. NPDC005529]|uniref:NADP-dependent oxidoreductase n=1 Tax=unclassified Streptomyces TaxID=2593676 RepID=UPI0033B73D1B
MKAAVIARHGKVADVVVVGDVADPVVGPHDVLIEAHAAGVNPVDYLIINGFMASEELAEPAVIGNEVAGVVTEIGDEVTRFSPGDEVFTRVDPRVGGAFAQYVSVNEELVAPKPFALSFVEAASLPLAALTAWQALTEQTKVEAGMKVLIHGGAGGVGSAAVQIAKHLGAKVVATASADSLDLVRDLGADQVIDYKSEQFDNVLSGLDVVFDTVGGDTQERSFRVLRPGGTLVSIIPIHDIEAMQALWTVEARSFLMHPDGGQLTTLASLVNSGHLRPIVEATFSLAETVDALMKVERGGARGKTVITIRP